MDKILHHNINYLNTLILNQDAMDLNTIFPILTNDKDKKL